MKIYIDMCIIIELGIKMNANGNCTNIVHRRIPLFQTSNEPDRMQSSWKIHICKVIIIITLENRKGAIFVTLYLRAKSQLWIQLSISMSELCTQTHCAVPARWQAPCMNVVDSFELHSLNSAKHISVHHFWNLLHTKPIIIIHNHDPSERQPPHTYKLCIFRIHPFICPWCLLWAHTCIC